MSQPEDLFAGVRPPPPPLPEPDHAPAATPTEKASTEPRSEETSGARWGLLALLTAPVVLFVLAVALWPTLASLPGWVLLLIAAGAVAVTVAVVWGVRRGLKARQARRAAPTSRVAGVGAVGGGVGPGRGGGRRRGATRARGGGKGASGDAPGGDGNGRTRARRNPFAALGRGRGSKRRNRDAAGPGAPGGASAEHGRNRNGARKGPFAALGRWRRRGDPGQQHAGTRRGAKPRPGLQTTNFPGLGLKAAKKAPTRTGRHATIRFGRSVKAKASAKATKPTTWWSWGWLWAAKKPAAKAPKPAGLPRHADLRRGVAVRIARTMQRAAPLRDIRLTRRRGPLPPITGPSSRFALAATLGKRTRLCRPHRLHTPAPKPARPHRPKFGKPKGNTPMTSTVSAASVAVAAHYAGMIDNTSPARRAATHQAAADLAHRTASELEAKAAESQALANNYASMNGPEAAELTRRYAAMAAEQTGEAQIHYGMKAALEEAAYSEATGH